MSATKERDTTFISTNEIVEFLRREGRHTAEQIREHFQREAVKKVYPFTTETLLWLINPYEPREMVVARKVLGIMDSVETSTSLSILLARGHLKADENFAYYVPTL